MAGTRRFVTQRAEVELDDGLTRAVNQLIRETAGDVVDAIEGIVNETAETTRAKWYTLVRRRSGRSGDGTDYRIEIRGNVIRGVVYNDARALAKQSINVDQQGNLRPGETKKSEQRVATEEQYAYFVHAPGALSVVYQPTPMMEYRELMRYFRRTGRLPPGYSAKSLEDKKGRRRPVGIGKWVRNPKASDGKRVWDTLVVKGHKAFVKERLADLDKALTATGKRIKR